MPSHQYGFAYSNQSRRARVHVCSGVPKACAYTPGQNPKLIRTNQRQRPIPKTWERMAGDNGVGFLDLPRELRDMIYNYICTNLSTNGDGWNDKHGAFKHYIPGSSRSRNLGIMETCRQVHWEFAETLYAQPLQLCPVLYKYRTQFNVAGSHILPLSLTYAHLVKKVAVLHDTEIRKFRAQYDLFETKTSGEEQWRHVVSIATRLGKLFPKIQTVRVLHRICPRDYGVDYTWQTVCGLLGDTREEQVEESEKFIRCVCWSDGRSIKMPPQLELMHLDVDTIVETPLVEAMRNVRAADMNKRGLKRKRSA